MKRGRPRLTGLLLGAALTASCEKVTVVTATVAFVQLAPPETSLIQGDSVQLSVVITDSDGNRLSGRDILWTTDEPGIATVDPSGMVVGLDEGVTAVRAFVETASASSTVTVLRGPTVGVSRPEVTFQGSADGPDPAPVAVAIFNDGAGELTGLVASVEYVVGSAGWLEANLGGPSAPTTLRLAARADGLAPGTYVGRVRVSSPTASAGTVTVTFDVSESAPVIGLSHSTVVFERGPDDTSVAQAAISVVNLGTQELSGLGAGVTYGAGEPTGWLVASLSPTTAPATLSLSASSAGFTAGTYSAIVDVLSPVALNSPQPVSVSLVVTEAPPTIVLSTSAIDFAVQEGDPPPPRRSIDVSNGGGGVLSGLTVAVDFGSGPSGWLTATLDQDVAPTALQVAVDPAGRAAGTYTASVVVSSPLAENSPQTVSVTMRVGDPSPTIVLSPTTVQFDGVAGGTDPAPVTVLVTNGGGGSLGGLSQSVTYDEGQAQGWLEATLAATEAPTDLQVAVSLGDLTIGNYGAIVSVSSAQAANSPQTVRVDLVVGSPPSAPSGLSAVAVAADQVDLAWTDNSDDENRFSIERSPGGSNAWQEIATVAPDVVAYSDQSVSEGTTYDYRVLACAGDLCSLPSNVASATTPSVATTPAAPSGLDAPGVGPNQVDLSWIDNSDNEDRFSIERSPGGANSWSEIASVGTDVVTYSDQTVAPSTSYDYRVIACSGELCSTPSNVASVTTPAPTPPSAPSGLGAVAVSPNQVDLDWTDNSDDEDRFSIERSPGGAGAWAEIATVGTDVATYSDQSVAPSTAYDYRVLACAGAVCSTPSNVASVTTPEPVPPTGPSGLGATAVSGNRVDLDWTDNSSDEDRFSIERSPGGAGAWAEIATVGTDVATYSDGSVAQGTAYDYRVFACAGALCSTPSNVASVTTPTPPAAPSGLSAQVLSERSVRLSWTDNSDNEDRFEIRWRRLNQGGGWSEAEAGPDTTEYTVTGLQRRRDYLFEVRACNVAGCSARVSVEATTSG